MGGVVLAVSARAPELANNKLEAKSAAAAPSHTSVRVGVIFAVFILVILVKVKE
jgi:hypothetical protein